MLKTMIDKLVRRVNLSEEEARLTMDIIMAGEATPAQIAAFITALRMKGETVDEITGCARAMRARAVRIAGAAKVLTLEAGEAEDCVDTCGTGGDGANTFNISTAVAFVAAGGGLSVAKHGNRAISSKCGSADVLEKLGINLNLTPEQAGWCLREIGVVFLFAPLYHSAMKHAAGVRREIGVRTIFNVLGPLANPAGTSIQVMGVYDSKLTEPLANVLGRLGLKRAMVVHGAGQLDEFSLLGANQVSELKHGEVRTFSVWPADFGLPEAQVEHLKGGDAEHNAELLKAVLCGEPGPRLDAVLMNAAAVFVTANRAENFKQGVEMARSSITSGNAREKLEALIKSSNSVAEKMA